MNKTMNGVRGIDEMKLPRNELRCRGRFVVLTDMTAEQPHQIRRGKYNSVLKDLMQIVI